MKPLDLNGCKSAALLQHLATIVSVKSCRKYNELDISNISKHITYKYCGRFATLYCSYLHPDMLSGGHNEVKSRYAWSWAILQH